MSPGIDFATQLNFASRKGRARLSIERRGTMGNTKSEGGHHFDFDTDKCTKCGMTRETYEDNGRPACTGLPQSPVPPRK